MPRGASWSYLLIDEINWETMAIYVGKTTKGLDFSRMKVWDTTSGKEP